MFTIDINGKPTECEINFGTALDYELEFGKDMVADVNGSVKAGDPNLITMSEDGEVVLGIDFTAVPWTTLLRVLWCAAKTRDPKIKPFKKWAADTRGINMFDARLLLSDEMGDCFFRNAPLDETQEDGAEQ